MNQNTVAFIIVTYNETRSTSRLVDSLVSWKEPTDKLHIIIVDNCSTDSTFDILNKKYAASENVDVIRSERNGGYGAGNNFGAKYAKEKYDVELIVISNPDILIEKNDFDTLLNAFSYPDIAVTTATMKNRDGTYKIRSIDIPTYKDDICACYGITNNTNIEKTVYYDTDEKFVISDFIPGCFFVIRAAIFENVGGFDENVFLFCEERIIGKKLKDAGYKQVICKDAFFLHDHSVTINKAFKTIKVNKLILKSRLYYNKHYSKISIAKYFFLYLSSRINIFGLTLIIALSNLKCRIIN